MLGITLLLNIPTGPTAVKESKGKPPNAGMVEGHSWEITESYVLSFRIGFGIAGLYRNQMYSLQSLPYVWKCSPKEGRKGLRDFVFMTAPDFLGPSEESHSLVQISEQTRR